LTFLDLPFFIVPISSLIVSLMRLPVNLIRTDGGTQARVSLSQRVVAEYALAMQQGHSFPPVVVFYDGTSYWLADGFHRLNASLKAGFAELTNEDLLELLAEFAPTVELKVSNRERLDAIGIAYAAFCGIKNNE
jgi:hypothetical protein